MGKDLGQVAETVKIARADVEFYGEKIILPETMKIPTAITVLQEREVYMQQKVVLDETFDVFPWDGARGLSEVLKQRFGWTSITNKGMWGEKKPPAYIQVEVAFGVTESVPWGIFELPGTTGVLNCSYAMKSGRLAFRIVAEIKRNDETFVREIFHDLREYLKTNSIYRGKAIKLRLYDDDGEKLEMPQPKFVDVSQIDRSQLILSEDVAAAVEANLFTPIERIKELASNGLPVKRGTLLGGKYGTGKTLSALVAARLAVQNNVTFIYIARANELAEAIAFGEQYQGDTATVVFCEDIDREMAGTQRTKAMDDILNIIDGIDSKSSRIMVVLTTNHLDKLNQAMLRPGRLDAVIEVTEPDAKAIEKLLRWYGGVFIDPDTDLTAVGVELSGQIPAVVAEVVKRAKLFQLRMQPTGVQIGSISASALLESAQTMRKQLALLEPKADARKTPLEEAFHGLVRDAVREERANAVKVAAGQ